MADVAAAAGVSRPLVSIVFRDMPGASEETRRHVREVADALGYRPHAAAQMLRRARSRNLGVLFSPQYPFEVEIVEAIYPAARDLGYRVVLGAMSPERDLDDAVDELLGYRSEALVIVGLDRDDDWFRRLLDRAPVVRIGRSATNAGVDVVHTDEHEGVDLAVGHLRALGHRSIWFLSGGDMPGAHEREAAYRSGMKARRLSREVQVIDGDYTDEAGARAATHILRSTAMPTAVITANDWSAVGLMTALLRAGIRVPDEISIVGYDDSRLAALSYVQLTSVGQDPGQLAAMAVHAAERRLADRETAATEHVIAPRLVVRTSTAPPNSQRGTP